MSLRKKKTFEDLVQENKNEMMKDDLFLERIEEKIEKRLHDSFKRDA
ncbi:FbpB family small basic protein [Aquibacillus rhizosphaerae]|uniref:FbpB family small basic protein n=1 Tax=Aquibacillus rhizosphaerae TaxID=3051431 RepID=A0ABT7L168_9BACI|nr:FbpB family small basic protein [Aquibacillus sp. LR5S19]MDL4839548.1 FbpB family small basic protein [Aquibacillus sp. LR5S19]